MNDTPKDALVPQRPQGLANRGFSLMPQSLGEAREIAELIARSDFAPKDYKGRPDNVIVALQMGADLGLKPMQALQNIAVINGRPSIYGDAALALAMDVLERFHEGFEGAENTDAFTAVCTSKRKGWPDETVTRFSIADAKKANLWGKAGPWTQYPKRMLQWRARGFNLRNVASDRLLGLVLVEEAQDYPTIEGTVVEDTTPPKALTVFEQLPEGIRDNIEKAFAILNMANGARLAKLNEWFGGSDIVPDEQAQGLLDWLRDEWSKRKSGKPRQKKGNGNAKVAKGTPDPLPVVDAVPVQEAGTGDRPPADPPESQSQPEKPTEDPKPTAEGWDF